MYHRLFVAGDTKLIPEMKYLGNIDITFIPLMSPYTMNKEIVLNAEKEINPKNIFIYYYKDIDKW